MWKQRVTSSTGIGSKRANPSIKHLQNARADLVTIYEALNQPDKARRFRAEITGTDDK